jgi:trigger factor
MKVASCKQSETAVTLNVVASTAEMDSLKKHVLSHYAHSVKLPGFRAGKAPLALIEKNVDPQVLQSEFLEEAITQMYQQAVAEQKLRVVEKPEIAIKKFVPYTTLEFEATVPVIGDIKLPDYKKITQKKTVVTITDKEVDKVLSSLAKRAAKRMTVARAAKAGDEVVIDFKGTDSKGQSIQGADGKSYPLLLGSDAFIPGFEKNVIGMKPKEQKTFTIPFPKDYGVKALASKKVTFEVTVQTVHELEEPTLNDSFAAQAGPFKSLKELKQDIRRQVGAEQQAEADRQDESELVKKITDRSSVSIPDVLIDNTVDSMVRELQQNLVYRGQTFTEFLAAEKMTDEAYRKSLRPQATNRVKASLVLAEIAEREKLDVSLEELEARIQLLMGQYQDTAMQAELDKPENRENVASRILTDKVLTVLKEHNLR